ncbi:MAG: hypothetical protein ACJAUP_003672, partial [Cellvibrionaceae bacterium]
MPLATKHSHWLGTSCDTAFALASVSKLVKMQAPVPVSLA